MPFIVHSVGDRWYGMWTLVGSFMGYYFVLDLGLTQATQRFIALAQAKKDQHELNTIIVTSLVILCLAGLASLFISIAIVFAAPVFLNNSDEIRVFTVIVLIMGINVALTMLLSVFNGVISANLRYDINCYVQLIKLIVRATLVFYFIGRGYSIVALAIITFSVNLMASPAIIVIARRLCGGINLRRIYFKKDTIRTLLGFGVYAFIARIAFIIRFTVDGLVIAHFLSLAFVTHYTVASRLADYFRDIMVRAFGIMTPVFARYHGTGDHENMRDKFILTTNFSVIAATIVCGAVLIFGKPFISRWMGCSYLDAYWPLVFLVTSSAFACMQIPSTGLLYGIAKHKFHAYVDAAEAVCNLGLSIILVRHYDLVGVAIGTAIPLYITRLFILPGYVCRQIGYPLSTYYHQMGKLFIATAAGQIPIWYLVDALEISSYSSMLLSGGIFYFIYAFIILRYVLPIENRQLLVNTIPVLKRIIS
jgi:O-antigen/teichoic acid export membrane protein